MFCHNRSEQWPRAPGSGLKRFDSSAPANDFYVSPAPWAAPECWIWQVCHGYSQNLMPSGARDGPDPTLIKMWTMAKRHISCRTVLPCSCAGTCQHQVFHLWKLSGSCRHSMTKADLSWFVPKTLTYRSFPAGQALPKPCVNSSLFLPSCSGILLPVTTDN